MSASVTIFRNVVWSRHKGVVFSALHNISASGAIRYRMVQIADTEHDRIGFPRSTIRTIVIRCKNSSTAVTKTCRRSR